MRFRLLSLVVLTTVLRISYITFRHWTGISEGRIQAVAGNDVVIERLPGYPVSTCSPSAGIPARYGLMPRRSHPLRSTARTRPSVCIAPL